MARKSTRDSASPDRLQGVPSPTLIDVAKVAGVSPITVSRALGRPEVVSSATRKRVLEAVRATGYVPNLAAGALASSRSRLVAIFLPTIANSIFADTVQVLTDHLAPNLIRDNPSDIARLWDKLCWAGASVGRSGLATQAIGAFDEALWDLKARRAGLSLARLLGAQRDSVRCYNTSGGFLHTPLEQLPKNTDSSREKGIGGIKLKVGQPDWTLDLHRVSSVRKHLGPMAARERIYHLLSTKNAGISTIRARLLGWLRPASVKTSRSRRGHRS